MLQRGRQIQLFKAVNIGKGTITNGHKPFRQGYHAGKPGIPEGFFTDGNNLLEIHAVRKITIVKSAGFNGLQCGGEGDAAQGLAVVEGVFADGFQAFRQLQYGQVVVTVEGISTDGLHSHAANGFRNGQVGSVTVVGCNGTGGGVKVELTFHIAVVINNQGIDAAGLNGSGAACG